MVGIAGDEIPVHRPQGTELSPYTIWGELAYVVLTLASQTDAFARQTSRLAALLSTVRGQELTEDAALGLAQQVVHDIRSVVARDAVTVVPVQAAEISRLLARRPLHARGAGLLAVAHHELRPRCQSLGPVGLAGKARGPGQRPGRAAPAAAPATGDVTVEQMGEYVRGVRKL